MTGDPLSSDEVKPKVQPLNKESRRRDRRAREAIKSSNRALVRETASKFCDAVFVLSPRTPGYWDLINQACEVRRLADNLGGTR